MNDIFSRLERLIKEKNAPVIAIDGRCAAGKTTLANSLAEKYGFAVIHMDDFFLPFDMRTAERLDEPGGNVHRERFAQEVIPKLGKELTYRVFSCADGTMDKVLRIPAGGVIVEGSYSMHPAFGRFCDLSVFMDISPELQRERIIARSGEAWWPDFRDKWIPMEEKYHREMNVRSRCDILPESKS